MAQRIQLRRAAGWRKPKDAVVVARPSRWGNPFRLVPASSRQDGPLDMWAVVYDGQTLGRFDDRHDAATDAVDRYRLWIVEQGLEAAIRAELGGKDLCCWCSPDQACHARALIEIANPSPETEGV